MKYQRPFRKNQRERRTVAFIPPVPISLTIDDPKVPGEVLRYRFAADGQLVTLSIKADADTPIEGLIRLEERKFLQLATFVEASEEVIYELKLNCARGETLIFEVLSEVPIRRLYVGMLYGVAMNMREIRKIVVAEKHNETDD